MSAFTSYRRETTRKHTHTQHTQRDCAARAVPRVSEPRVDDSDSNGLTDLHLPTTNCDLKGASP